MIEEEQIEEEQIEEEHIIRNVLIPYSDLQKKRFPIKENLSETERKESLDYYRLGHFNEMISYAINRTKEVGKEVGFWYYYYKEDDGKDAYLVMSDIVEGTENEIHFPIHPKKAGDGDQFYHRIGTFHTHPSFKNKKKRDYATFSFEDLENAISNMYEDYNQDEIMIYCECSNEIVRTILEDIESTFDCLSFKKGDRLKYIYADMLFGSSTKSVTELQKEADKIYKEWFNEMYLPRMNELKEQGKIKVISL